MRLRCENPHNGKKEILPTGGFYCAIRYEEPLARTQLVAGSDLKVLVDAGEVEGDDEVVMVPGWHRLVCDAATAEERDKASAKEKASTSARGRYWLIKVPKVTV